MLRIVGMRSFRTHRYSFRTYVNCQLSYEVYRRQKKSKQSLFCVDKMDVHLLENKLLNHDIFKVFKEGFSEDSENLKNLIELQDDILYLWHPAENCLLTLNLKYFEEKHKDTSYQRLQLLQPPSFEVERLLVGAGGSRLCVWGTRGAVVVELPTKWGRHGLFDGKNKTVYCKTYPVDERFLYSLGEVRRVLWHPDSLSHLLILVSDNTIRLYNIGLKSGTKLVKILTIGPKPSCLLAGKGILESLGDTAVDFTPVPCTSELLVLRGNGDVYMITCDIECKSPIPPQLRGPLTMYPPADDNYGEDSCCIIVIGGTLGEPPLVVIATSSALLYHCLLLRDTACDEDQYKSKEKNGPGYSLYVVEAVELNISLGPDEVQFKNSYPVHLYPCAGNNSSYACMHAAGVHTVTLPIIQQLKEYTLADDSEIESLVSSVHSRASVARYVVCTHAGRGELRPPAGLAVRAPPLPAMILLCGDGTPVLRMLEPDYLEEQLYKEIQLKNPALDEDEINKILIERQKLSFSSVIQEILTRNVSQPILKVSSKEDPRAKEFLEFLTQATLKLRQEYISRQISATEAIRKKVSSLSVVNKQQLEWFADIRKEMDDVKLKSAILQEKCALAEKHQEDLKYRCSAVIRALRANMSTNPAEREILRDLHKYKENSDVYAQQIKKLKERANAKSRELQKWHDEYKKKNVALGKSHSDTISSILQQQTNQISYLIEETKLLKDQLGIV